jgi:addiction module HigA family antidote
MNKMRPIHPGEVLREEFLEPLDLSAHALSVALRVPEAQVFQVISITAHDCRRP